MIRNWIKHTKSFKRLSKSPAYVRTRQYFPQKEPAFVDDSHMLDEALVVTIDWPQTVKKPVVGIVQDYGNYPRWTKFRRFCKNNSIDCDIFNIHRHDWVKNAENFDVIVGLPSNSIYSLQEMRSKYHILETYLGKKCYPSANHTMMYDDKCLEAYISQATGIPFANTFVSYDKEEAQRIIDRLQYPFVSKIVPSSSSIGVELISSRYKGAHIVKEAFSRSGRKTHYIYYYQKNFIYFQEFIPNDGYDIRIIVVGKWVFGYFRKVLEGDIRASGMDQVEMRALPEEAMKIAIGVNKIINSPVLAVDMLHGLDGKYYIIEFSPLYRMDSSAELIVNGEPGVYIFDDEGSYHFDKGRYWVAELALKEFLVNQYL